MIVLAHGVDIVEVPRIDEMLQRHGQRFIGRCFTSAESAYAESGPRLRVQRYAVRFAAKEAVLKALGTGWRSGIHWTDIEIRREPSGKPMLTLVGRCEELARKMGVTRWHISLSHTAEIALASVIGCGPDSTR